MIQVGKRILGQNCLPNKTKKKEKKNEVAEMKWAGGL